MPANWTSRAKEEEEILYHTQYAMHRINAPLFHMYHVSSIDLFPMYNMLLYSLP